MSAVLSLRSLSVSYGGVRALKDVDLEVEEGQLVGLIGPNGAGKTTLIDACGGFTRAGGEVRLDGEDLSSLLPHRRARRGLVRTWQATDLFEDLTVRENLLVAAGDQGWWATIRESFRGSRGAPDSIDEALAELGLESLAGRGADELTQGQRKLVGVARSLVGRPRVVCLDEPAAGLDTWESRDLGQRLRKVVDGGLSMLLVDHDMGLVLTVCDQVVVLNFGEVIAKGSPAEVRRDPAVIEAYLGSAAAEVIDGEDERRETSP